MLGKAPTKMRPQNRRIRNRSTRRNNIANQPLAPGTVLARNHRSLRNRPMPNQRRLDLARLDPEPAHLHLRIRTPKELQHPVAAPARKVPVRYIRLPATPNGSATNRSAVSPARPT